MQPKIKTHKNRIGHRDSSSAIYFISSFIFIFFIFFNIFPSPLLCMLFYRFLFNLAHIANMPNATTVNVGNLCLLVLTTNKSMLKRLLDFDFLSNAYERVVASMPSASSYADCSLTTATVHTNPATHCRRCSYACAMHFSFTIFFFLSSFRFYVLYVCVCDFFPNFLNFLMASLFIYVFFFYIFLSSTFSRHNMDKCSGESIPHTR